MCHTPCCGPTAAYAQIISIPGGRLAAAPSRARESDKNYRLPDHSATSNKQDTYTVWASCSMHIYDKAEISCRVCRIPIHAAIVHMKQKTLAIRQGSPSGKHLTAFGTLSISISLSRRCIARMRSGFLNLISMRPSGSSTPPRAVGSANISICPHISKFSSSSVQS